MLNKLCQKYIRNISAYYELENYDYNTISSKQKVLSTLKEKTKEKHQIYMEQNEILTKLYAKMGNLTKITKEDYEVLNNFGEELSQSQIEMDNATAFAVRKVLLALAEANRDMDEIVNQTYWCGICEWKYYKMDALRPEYSYFEKMCEYKESLSLVSPSVRRRYIAGVINQMLYYTNKDATPLIQKGKDVLVELEWLEKEYPDTLANFNALHSIIYRNMVTAEKSFREQIDLTEENVQYIYEVAQKSMELIEHKDDTSIPFETVYYMDLYIAEFHAHIIDIDTLLLRIERLCIPSEEYSEKENYNRVLRNTSLYILYINKYAPYEQKMIKEQILSKVTEVFYFLSKIKRDNQSAYVGEYVLQFVQNTIDVLPFDMVKEIVFRTMMSQHRETCVHNLMVERISHTLLKAVIEKHPEQLIGVMNYHSVEEVVAHKKELLHVMEDMALVHDVGKYKCISIISNASRKLDDTEFGIIKLHPIFGYDLMKNALVPDALKEGILLHHKWHDGNGGYPQQASITNNQPLIDILSIADSLDAATDPYGRSYSVSKNLDQLIEEFDSFKDTRYADFVIQVLKNPMVKLQVHHLLNHTRNELAAYVCQKKFDKIIEFYPERAMKSTGEMTQ